MTAKQRIFECGIVPVIKLQNAQDAIKLCKALSAGGIDVAEVTFRTDAAADAIAAISENLPDVFVGAGTVTNPGLAETAIKAGAKFIVSPGFNPRVVEYCLEHDVPIFPGVATPSDIEAALNYGLTTLKFFPAEANGGLKALKALAAPYGGVMFMPTGGIDQNNVSDYLAFDRIIACGGTWMVKEELVATGQFDKITQLSKEAVNIMHGFTFAHMAINTDSKEAALGVTNRFGELLGVKTYESTASAFATDQIEIMFAQGPGEKGHIGFTTNNVKRAMAYFKRVGIEINFDSIRGTEDAPTFFYLKEPVGGFAVHVMKK